MACAAGLSWTVIAFSAAQPSKEEALPYAIPDAVRKQTKPIFDGKTLDGWIQVPAASWIVKDGAMASTGAGRWSHLHEGGLRPGRCTIKACLTSTRTCASRSIRPPMSQSRHDNVADAVQESA